MKNESATKIQQVRVALSRRAVLGGMGLAALPIIAPALTLAQDAPASSLGRSQLPLRTTGLEHMGCVVPDVTVAAKFHSRVFNTEVHKEKELPLRYYVTMGVGYIAFGSRPNQTRSFFDHFCALVEDYDRDAMDAELKSLGLPASRRIISDPDRIGFQLLSVPGGLAKSTEPAGKLVEGDALVEPIGLSEVVLRVADLDKSLGFYRRFFGAEAASDARGARFEIVGTRLLIERAQAGEESAIDRIGVKVQPFNRASLSAELTKLGAKIEPGAGLRFRDPQGLGIELLPV